MALTKRFIKLSVVTVIALGVLVLNPVFGVLSGPDYEFGAAELRAAVEGTWQLTIAAPGAPQRTITFTLAQGAEPAEPHAAWHLVRPAAACGSRSLVKTAGACGDLTNMPLEVTVIAGGVPQQHPLQGRFMVDGTRFHSGDLRVDVGGVSLLATLTSAGDVLSVSSYMPDERDVPDATSPRITSTLIRTKH
jgi:hypothetical protein